MLVTDSVFSFSVLAIPMGICLHLRILKSLKHSAWFAFVWPLIFSNSKSIASSVRYFSYEVLGKTWRRTSLMRKPGSER